MPALTLASASAQIRAMSAQPLFFLAAITTDTKIRSVNTTRLDKVNMPNGKAQLAVDAVPLPW